MSTLKRYEIAQIAGVISTSSQIMHRLEKLCEENSVSLSELPDNLVQATLLYELVVTILALYAIVEKQDLLKMQPPVPKDNIH